MISDIQALAAETENISQTTQQMQADVQQTQEIIKYMSEDSNQQQKQILDAIHRIGNQLEKLNEGAKRGKIHLETTFSSYMSFIYYLNQTEFAAGL